MLRYINFEPQRRLGHYSLALSPDGKHVAYADDALGQFNVAVQVVDGEEPPRHLTSFVDATVKSIVWHPDGEMLYFFADTMGRENSQIFRVSVAGGEPEALTDAPDSAFEVNAPCDPFSPNGLYLAYGGNDRTPQNQDLLVRNLRSGEVRRLYERGGNIWSGYWSPNGKWLTASDLRVPLGDHVVYLVETETGEVRRLTPQDPVGTYWLGPWLPDGSGFLVWSNAGREFQGLAVMDPESGSLSWLDTPDWDVEEAALSRDGRILAWTVNSDGATRLRARDLKTGNNLNIPELPVGEGWALNISADGSRVALMLSTPTRPWNVLTVELATGEVRWITDVGPRDVDQTDLIEPRVNYVQGADGTSIPALLYLPPGPGPFPVVMSIHGGPSSQERPKYAGEGLYQYLASQGVAVFAPNMRGSRGYGLSYQRALDRDWGGIDLSDFADAAHYLRTQDWVKEDRIGLFGHSYGGFAVLSCLSRLPELGWAAGVSWCGPSNLVTVAKGAPPTWRAQVAAKIGDYENDSEFLTSRSPVMYADEIRAPLLVIQGANDRRVPQHESDQIVERLRARGVDVRYDVYSDEGHVFSKRANESKARSDAAEFLLSHLLS